MSGLHLLSTCGLLVGAVVLLASGTFHLVRPRALTKAIAEHRVIPTRLRGPAATAITGAELMVAVFSIAAAVEFVESTRVAAAAQAALFSLLAIYAYVSSRRATAGANCGCGPFETTPNGLVIVRTGALAVVAVAVVAISSPLHVERLEPTPSMYTFLAFGISSTLALLLLMVPAARRLPTMAPGFGSAA